MTKTTILFTAGLLSAFLAFPASAGTWQQNDDTTWSYVNDDGSYATGWINDNGKDYYINDDGVMLSDQVTPDGYYVDASGAWDGQAALAPAQPQSIYQPGKYAVGADIPAGEYVVFAVSDATLPYYEIRANNDFASYEDIIDNCLFGYNAIIQLQEGQFLNLDDCTAVPMSEVPQIDTAKGEMFKVGYHIKAGTYTIRASNGEAYCTVYSSPHNTYSGYISRNLVEGEMKITLKSGTYLRLTNCYLADN